MSESTASAALAGAAVDEFAAVLFREGGTIHQSHDALKIDGHVPPRERDNLAAGYCWNGRVTAATVHPFGVVPSTKNTTDDVT
jgi:hypothetical protein